MKYHIHIGTGVEDAKNSSAICEFDHEFISELIEIIEKNPGSNIFLNNFDPTNKYLEINGNFGDLEKVKNTLNNVIVKDCVESDFACLFFACEKALKNNMHLYLIME